MYSLIFSLSFYHVLANRANPEYKRNEIFTSSKKVQVQCRIEKTELFLLCSISTCRDSPTPRIKARFDVIPETIIQIEMNLFFICLIFSSASSEETELVLLRKNLISNLKVTVKIRVRLKLS